MAKKETGLKGHKEEILIILLFLLGFYLRLNLDKLYIGNPGNLKAADPMYYTLATETIIETNRYGFFPDSITFGEKNIVDAHPPLQNIISAFLSEVGNIESWNSLYILICLLSSLGIIILYRLGILFFKSKEIGLIAAGLFVLPMSIQKWFYFLYIGMWSTVGGLSFFLINFWLIFEYYFKPKRWKLILLGISLASTFLIHFPELIITLPFLLFVGFRIWVEKKGVVFNLACLGIPTALSFLFFLPKFLLLLTTSQGEGFSLGFFSHEGSKALPFYAGFSDFHVIILVFLILGVGQLLLNFKKYKEYVLSFGFILFYLFVVSHFAKSDLHFVRQRSLLPYFAFLTAGYGIYYLVVKNVDKLANAKGIYKTATVIAIIALFVILSLSKYKELSNNLNYQHLTPEKYNAMKWIQSVVPDGKSVLFFTGFYQNSPVWSKRSCYFMEADWIIEPMKKFFETNKTQLVFYVAGPCANTELMNSANTKQESLLMYVRGYVKTHNTNASLTDFDYIVMQNGLFNQEFAQALYVFQQDIVNELMSKHNYQLMYNKDNTIIVGKA